MCALALPILHTLPTQEGEGRGVVGPGGEQVSLQTPGRTLGQVEAHLPSSGPISELSREPGAEENL